jgi:MFS family permease
MVTPRFLLVTAATFAYYLCVGILIPTLPVFIKNGLGSGEAMIGAAGVVFSGAAVLFRPLLTWVGNRWGRRTMMVTGSLVAAVAALAKPFEPACACATRAFLAFYSKISEIIKI